MPSASCTALHHKVKTSCSTSRLTSRAKRTWRDFHVDGSISDYHLLQYWTWKVYTVYMWQFCEPAPPTQKQRKGLVIGITSVCLQVIICTTNEIAVSSHMTAYSVNAWVVNLAYYFEVGTQKAKQPLLAVADSATWHQHHWYNMNCNELCKYLVVNATLSDAICIHRDKQK